MEEISRLVHDAGALLVLDTVTSLGGCPVTLDAWNVDAAYSGTQKCLSCPPGLSPVSFNQAALDKLGRRKSKVKSWYLDLTMIARYWGEDRAYHHTAPISMNYGLHAALSEVEKEGLEARFARHELNHRALAAGLEVLGIQLAAQEGHRLWMLNSVKHPRGRERRRGAETAAAGLQHRDRRRPRRPRRQDLAHRPHGRIEPAGERGGALVEALGQILKEEGADIPVADAIGAIEGVYAGT